MHGANIPNPDRKEEICSGRLFFSPFLFLHVFVSIKEAASSDCLPSPSLLCLLRPLPGLGWRRSGLENTTTLVVSFSLVVMTMQRIRKRRREINIVIKLLATKICSFLGIIRMLRLCCCGLKKKTLDRVLEENGSFLPFKLFRHLQIASDYSRPVIDSANSLSLIADCLCLLLLLLLMELRSPEATHYFISFSVSFSFSSVSFIFLFPCRAPYEPNKKYKNARRS